SEGLQATIGVGRLILPPDQPLLVRKTRLLERPAHAQVAHHAAGERRHPAKRADPDHGRTSGRFTNILRNAGVDTAYLLRLVLFYRPSAGTRLIGHARMTESNGSRGLKR